MNMKNAKQGFTLIEIMIVVAIIGILAAIAVPNFLQSRRTSQKNACISNMRQIANAVEQWKIDGKPTSKSWKDYVKNPDSLKCPSTSTAYTPALDKDGSGAGDEVVTCGETDHILPEYTTTTAP